MKTKKEKSNTTIIREIIDHDAEIMVANNKLYNRIGINIIILSIIDMYKLLIVPKFLNEKEIDKIKSKLDRYFDDLSVISRQDYLHFTIELTTFINEWIEIAIEFESYEVAKNLSLIQGEGDI